MHHQRAAIRSEACSVTPSIGSVVACMSRPCVTPCAGPEGPSSAQVGPLQQGMSAMLGDAVQQVSCRTDMHSLHGELHEAHRSNQRLQDGILSLIASHVRLLPALGSACAAHHACTPRFCDAAQAKPMQLLTIG